MFTLTNHSAHSTSRGSGTTTHSTHVTSTLIMKPLTSSKPLVSQHATCVSSHLTDSHMVILTPCPYQMLSVKACKYLIWLKAICCCWSMSVSHPSPVSRHHSHHCNRPRISSSTCETSDNDSSVSRLPKSTSSTTISMRNCKASYTSMTNPLTLTPSRTPSIVWRNSSTNARVSSNECSRHESI